jgi:hypothetical protein
VAGAQAVATASIAVLGAITETFAVAAQTFGTAGTIFLFISLNAFHGAAAGLLIGLLRTYIRLQSRMTDSLIGAIFSRRLFQQLSTVPGSYQLILLTLLTTTLVGYAVGVLAKIVGLPPLFSQEFVGPVAVLVLSGPGGGGAGPMVFWLLGLILIVMSLAVAIAVAITSNVLLAACAGALGGSAKGLVKGGTVATIERNLGSPGSHQDRRPLMEISAEGATTGAITGGIVSVFFAFNTAGIDPLTLGGYVVLFAVVAGAVVNVVRVR